MKKIISLLFVFSFATVPLFGSPVFDLYTNHGVQYIHDCHRTDWLGFYRPLEDRIHLRPTEKYRKAYLLNHTALHELGHWSRHKSRLGPPKGTSYMEEIMCDMTAAIIADEMKVDREEDHAIGAYVKLQLANHKVNMEDWQNLHNEVHKTVEYLLQRPYAKEKIKDYFRAFNAMPEEKITLLK